MHDNKRTGYDKTVRNPRPRTLKRKNHTSDTAIARVLTGHERLTNTVVPRRATVHDVGTGLTHKRIICWKRYAEGKEPHLVARRPTIVWRPSTVTSANTIASATAVWKDSRPSRPRRPGLRPALGPGVSCDR